MEPLPDSVLVAAEAVPEAADWELAALGAGRVAAGWRGPAAAAS